MLLEWNSEYEQVKKKSPPAVPQNVASISAFMSPPLWLLKRRETRDMERQWEVSLKAKYKNL